MLAHPVHMVIDVHKGQRLFRSRNGGPNAQKRRKAEDQMAMIFVAIVTNFLVTNFPRILLNFHEVLVIENYMICSEAGLP